MNKSKIWVPPQRERYTKVDLLAAAREIGCRDVRLRTIRTFIELGLLNHPVRNWPGYGGSSSEGWWSRSQFELWCALMNQRKRITAREGHKAQISAALCNVVVAAWLYFGEAVDIPLTQVQRAMETWAKANATVRSLAEANRQTKAFVRTAGHPSSHLPAKARRKLRADLAAMLYTGQYPDQEMLLYKMQMLIDPNNRGEIKGPIEAPISAENLTDMILGRADMLAKLEKGADTSPNGLWEWARCMLLWSRAQYQAAQPRIASNPSLKKRPELARLYQPEDFEALVNAACENLLTVLSTAELAEQAVHLQPPLHPGPWRAGQMHLKVEGRQRLSELQLPTGDRQAYLAISIEPPGRCDPLHGQASHRAE